MAKQHHYTITLYPAVLERGFVVTKVELLGEQLITTCEWDDIFMVLDQAVAECTDRDVRDEALFGALGLVGRNVEKGEVLAARFLTTLDHPIASIRQETLAGIVAQLKRWCAYG